VVLAADVGAHLLTRGHGVDVVVGDTTAGIVFVDVPPLNGTGLYQGAPSGTPQQISNSSASAAAFRGLLGAAAKTALVP